MCGIFAYLNFCVPRKRKYILELLISGLHRLEYRGYDSAGVAYDGFGKMSIQVSVKQLMGMWKTLISPSCDISTFVESRIASRNCRKLKNKPL